ncbi:BREX system ATP-binding domain-containing protein [Ruminiclostridium cellobioparum]|uniref:BREX system ATP-binding domain-containing protein n=1 Tax=Ruminiclostridium cellobioparum TaxID=29355 RepID=UPI0028AB1AC0|nr:BREX system ATP-binding domain-containing protein [Ruminiclostridium cellobioparum]
MDLELGKSVIKALHNGNVPSIGAGYIMAGHEEEKNKIVEELEYIRFEKNKTSHSGFKMLYGPYGSGKSFLCEILKDEALASNFVVSEVVISRNTQLHNFETVYNKIMAGLRTDEFREFSAFRIIIENWLNKSKKEIIKKFDLDPDENEKDEEKLVQKLEEKILIELGKANTTNPSIINAVSGFYKAVINGDHALAQNALGWLAGEQHVQTNFKKQMNVKGNVDKTNVFEFLRTLLYIIEQSGYAGLLIIIDEVETVRKERRDVRYQAYENLRMLLDMVSKDNLPGCYLLLTGTDDLVEQEDRGIKEHDALYTRLEPIRLGDIKVLDQPLMRLSRFDTQQLINVAKKVRDLHSSVYNWNADDKISDTFITQYATNFSKAFGKEISTLPRTFLKNFAFILEAAKTESMSKIKSLLNISEEQIQSVNKQIEQFGRETAMDIEL